jgi:hypothetical protein
MHIEYLRYLLVWLLLFSGGLNGSYTYVKMVAGGTACKSRGGQQTGHWAPKGLIIIMYDLQNKCFSLLCFMCLFVLFIDAR